jgi:hypothetical protein
MNDDEKSSLKTLPINLIGVIRHFSPDEANEPLSLDPLLFHGLHPDTSTYFWYSVQKVYGEPDGSKSLDALVLVSWLVKDPERDAIPTTNCLRIAKMKQRTNDFAPHLRRLVHGIPDDTEAVTALTLADFGDLAWPSQAKVTLAGDAAHAMTMIVGRGPTTGFSTPHS